jgi:hypothetical protein
MKLLLLHGRKFLLVHRVISRNLRDANAASLDGLDLYER